MDKKSIYETPLIEIISLQGFDVLTVSGDEVMEPDGVYDETMEWL